MAPVIIAAARTAVGNFGGSLSKVSAPALGAAVITAVLKRGGVESSKVDEVIMGNVLTAGLGQNPARQAAMKAGLPQETLDQMYGRLLAAVRPRKESLVVYVTGCYERQIQPATFEANGLELRRRTEVYNSGVANKLSGTANTLEIWQVPA